MGEHLVEVSFVVARDLGNAKLVELAFGRTSPDQLGLRGRRWAAPTVMVAR
jgi:hypothetical protein